MTKPLLCSIFLGGFYSVNGAIAGSYGAVYNGNNFYRVMQYLDGGHNNLRETVNILYG